MGKSAPNLEKIKSLQIPTSDSTSFSEVESIFKNHTFPSFNAAFCHSISRTQIEDPDSITSKASFVIFVVSADEGDVGEAINKIKMANLDKLEEWFGLSRGR